MSKVFKLCLMVNKKKPESRQPSTLYPTLFQIGEQRETPLLRLTAPQFLNLKNGKKNCIVKETLLYL